MTQSFPKLGVVMLAFALSAQLFGQTTSSPTPKRRKPASAAPVASQADLQSLRDLVDWLISNDQLDVEPIEVGCFCRPELRSSDGHFAPGSGQHGVRQR